MTTDNTHHFDATLATFETDVLAKSAETPVLVDFWADWCAPCKQLKPVLEKLAEEYGGAFILAKVDTEAEQQLATMFGIRSLPTVLLLKNGQPLDGFQGAQTESTVKALLAKHGIEPNIDIDLGEDAPAEGQEPSAQAVIKTQLALLERNPNDWEAKLTLSEALVQNGQADDARGLLDDLPAGQSTDSRADVLPAWDRLMARRDPSADLANIEHQLDASGNAMRIQEQLGLEALANGQAETALSHFLTMLKADKNFDDGLPRTLLLDAFKVIGDAQVVSKARRQMSSILF